MAMTDHILFVKETKTCSYVLVIHTPRLCGEPGFKSPKDANEQGSIRCREIVSELPPAETNAAAQAHWPVPSGDTPLNKSKSKRKTVPRVLDAASTGAVAAAEAAAKAKQPLYGSGSSSVKMGSFMKDSIPKTQQELYDELVKKTVELLREAEGQKNAGTSAGDTVVTAEFDEDGQLIIEYDEIDETSADAEIRVKRMVEALRAAGYNVEGEIVSTTNVRKGTKDKDQRKGGKGTKDSKSRRRSNGWFGGRFEL